MSTDSDVDLSIIVCTSGRYDLIDGCVQSVLADPSFDPLRCEVVVVDNTPTPSRRPWNAPSPSVRMVLCETPGLSAARNRGIRESRGAVVAFIDDDARPHASWCASTLEAFRRFPRAKICGGRSLVRLPSAQPPPWFYEELEQMLSGLDLGNAARPIRADEWIVGTNMAFRREVFADGRGFDENLGRRPGSLLSNEDNEIVSRVGRKYAYYVPAMVVDHLVPAERIERSWFLDRARAQAASDLASGLTPDALAVAQRERQARSVGPRDPETGDPQAFRREVRLAYLDALLSDVEKDRETPPPAGLRIRLQSLLYRLESAAHRLGLVRAIRRARLAWRSRSR